MAVVVFSCLEENRIRFVGVWIRVRPNLWAVKCLGDELLAAGDYRVGRNEGNESCLVCSSAFLFGRKGDRRRGRDDSKSVYEGYHAHAVMQRLYHLIMAVGSFRVFGGTKGIWKKTYRVFGWVWMPSQNFSPFKRLIHRASCLGPPSPQNRLHLYPSTIV